jgi:hypothetical protein
MKSMSETEFVVGRNWDGNPAVLEQIIKDKVWMLSACRDTRHVGIRNSLTARAPSLRAL